jgi:hypothetical protein
MRSGTNTAPSSSQSKATKAESAAVARTHVTALGLRNGRGKSCVRKLGWFRDAAIVPAGNIRTDRGGFFAPTRGAGWSAGIWAPGISRANSMPLVRISPGLGKLDDTLRPFKFQLFLFQP